MAAPAPLPVDEAERLAALCRYAVRDTQPEEPFDRLTRMAARHFETPMAAVTLVDKDRGWLRAQVGFDGSEVPRDISVCARAVMGAELLIVPDATTDPRFADNPIVVGGPQVRFYAGAPLISSEGRVLGALCIFDVEPRDGLSAKDQSLLIDLATMVVEQIELRHAAKEARGELEGRIQAERDLAFAEYKLDLFFEHVPVSLAMFDRDMQYIAASRLWRRSLSVEDEDIVGRSHFEIVPYQPEHWRSQYARCIAGEDIDVDEDHIDMPDGTRYWIRRKLRPWRDRHGKIGGLIAFVEVINDRKQTEEELERSRSFTEAVLENIKDGIVACNADGELTVFNAASRRMFGRGAEPMPLEDWATGDSLFEADSETPLPLERNMLHRALNGEIVQGEAMVVAPKGIEARRVIVNSTPMFDATGSKLGAVCMLHDITREHAAEERWRETHARYRAIFDQTFQFTALLSAEGIVLEMNQTVLDFGGITREQATGRPMWGLRWWNGSVASRTQLRNAVRRARTGAFVRFETEIRGADGSFVPLDFSLKPVTDETGRITMLIAEGRDQTDVREREAHLRLISDNVPFLITYFDKDLRFRFINSAGAAWYGLLAKEDVAGRSLDEVLGSDVVAAVTPHLKKAAAGEDQVFEANFTYPDGVTRDVRVLYIPDMDDAGVMRGVIAIVTDITDQKRADRELRRRQVELELLINNVPTQIFFKDDKNRFLRLNEPAARFLGAPVEDLEGKNLNEILPPEKAECFYREDLEMLETGKPLLGLIAEHTYENGESGRFRIDKVPYVDKESGERFIFVSATDITAEQLAEEALRESEERYRTLYNNTPVMLHSIDAEGRLLSVSDFWLEKLGYRRDEVIGRRSTDFLTPESATRAIEDVIPEFLRTGSCHEVPYQFVTKSGEVIDTLLSAVADEDGTNSVRRSLAVITDITERKIVEQQLIQAQKMETVGQLTGGLAHDFNNLLGVVLGNLQLIERAVRDDAKAVRRITAALAAVDRGAELTRRLLAFSRRQQLETEVVRPGPLVETMSKMARRVLGEGISLQCALEPDMPPIKTDPAQLESALLNLAVNARDAMPKGGTLTIESQVVALDADYAAREQDVTPGTYVMIAVTDTGVGIPAEVLQKVYEPFFTTKEVGRGTGLGLSMVYGFMKQSGGHVRIYSEVGRGTTVRLYLPVSDDEATAERLTEADLGAAAGGGETILVVEDQDDVREVAVALLEDLGYTVMTASDGRAGLEVLKSATDIDLLFSDIVMPGNLDGTRLAEMARRLRPGLPVVFTTGYAETAILSDDVARTTNILVTKPYRRADLASKIRQALDGVRLDSCQDNAA